MDELKLYMVLLGCKPNGRFTEQHDLFFGIGRSLKELLPEIKSFWKNSGELHIDAWREVTAVSNHRIEILPADAIDSNDLKLFFINLGGYRENEFDEFHYKVLAVADSLSSAIKQSKATTFYKHCGFKGATSHIDDKYGIDVDDAHKVEDILPTETKSKYRLKITPAKLPEDEMHLGYLKLSKL